MNLARVSKKIPHEDNRITMTAIHEKKIKEFNDYYNTLSDKQKQLEHLNKKLRTMKNNKQHSLKKQINSLQKEIENIINKTELTEYLLKAQYYIDEYKNSTIVINNNVNNDNIVDDNVNDDNNDYNDDNYNDNFIIKSNKGQISQQYIQECISNDFIIKQTEKNILRCDECNVDRILLHSESSAVCPSCSGVIQYQDNDMCNEFSEEIEVSSPFNYKRINHFKEWISRLLARESSSPPQEVIDIILLELKKDRIKDKELVTKQRIRGYLRKNGLNKMYEHIPFIIHKICGTSPPTISKELEAKLIKLFEEIQIPFEKHKPPQRKNFLSYAYCLHKLCLFLGEYELAKTFSLLNSRDKLYEHEQIMKAICEQELKIPWISSI